MRRFTGVALAGAGIVLLLLGLLFLVGAGGQARRLVVAVVGLGLGGVATGLGVRLVRSADAVSPERLRAEIMELAGREDGELAQAEAERALGGRAVHALPTLAAMASDGLCRRRVRDGTVYWVFEGLLPRLSARFCEYCEAEFQIGEEVSECPNCGGPLQTRVVSRSVGEGELYGMD